MLLALRNPLSYSQQRLWFIDQLIPDSPLYNVPGAVRLIGSLDITALQHCFDEILKRHDVLRTSFTSIEGRPLQIVSHPVSMLLPVLDLSRLSKAQREAETRRLIAEEAQRPFNLSRGHLLRVTILRLADNEHVVLLTMHHIISDGWSMSVLIQEVSALYTAFSAGVPSPLPELTIQYADYAQWQRQHLSGEALDEQLAYWRDQLRETGVLELPTDRPRPAVQTHHGSTINHVLSPELTAQLQQLSQREGTTLFMTLLAAWQVLLMRYSGQCDISVGTPVAGRTRAEVEPLIGFFVNTLVLRTGMSGGESFREMLAKVREVCLGAYAHQDVPFEMLVEQLQPARSLSHSPLFQVMFALQNTPVQSLNLPGVTLERVEVESRTAIYDLTLAMAEVETGLLASMEYNTDLFDEATISRMLGHYERLLRSVVEDAGQRISEMALLSDEEAHQLLVEWNDTRDEWTIENVHELFEQQVRRTPHEVAIVFEQEEVSYAELNRRANQVGHYLRGQGVGAEVAVGVCVERSVEMVVGLLGVLKAGGVYVPLDATYPQERLAFMMEDSGVSVLLTQERLMEGVPSSAINAKVICLDRDLDLLAQESDANLQRGACADNLAYVIYTSGSTGIPKGALIRNGPLANYCVQLAALFELNGSDRVLQFSSINFDVSLEEILPALISGSRLVLRDMDMWSASELHHKIEEHGLTVMDLPTAYWQLVVQDWVNRPDLRVHERLKAVFVGGEAMLPETVNLWQQTSLNTVRLVQGYGPTETTIASTIFEMVPRTPGDAPLTRFPIGRPIANTTIYILDRAGRPTPVGVPGELYIGGAFLARGYLNRPGQTAENFLPDPFGGDAGGRLYRTGDRARYLSDGNIEFQGRNDYQVKIRGFRVELGEIESALNEHPALRESVVVSREDEHGDKRLVAYVVAVSGQPPGGVELRNYLKERLPEYMIPSAFVTLDELPVSPSGKVNRRALPAPEMERLQDVDFIAPSTPNEELIAGIWSKALKIEQVGVNDNFFDLGGHSLLLVKVHGRLSKELDKQISLMRLFQYPTVRTLAQFLSTEEEAASFTMQQSEDWAEKRKQALKRQRRVRVN